MPHGTVNVGRFRSWQQNDNKRNGNGMIAREWHLGGSQALAGGAFVEHKEAIVQRALRLEDFDPVRRHAPGKTTIIVQD